MVTIDNKEKEDAAVVLVKRLTEATLQGKLEWVEDPRPSFGRAFDTTHGPALLRLSLHANGSVCALAVRRKMCTDSLFISARDAEDEVTGELIKLSKAVVPQGPLSSFPGWVQELHDELA